MFNPTAFKFTLTTEACELVWLFSPLVLAERTWRLSKPGDSA
jgi:hypothetical protein